MVDFYKDMVKEMGKDGTSILSDGLATSEFSGWIDTGSYILNAQLSGSLYGGLADNKAMAIAGEEATGKTFFALGLVHSFQKAYENAGVFYFDTESAVTEDMMLSREIDPKRVIVSEPDTVEEFRTNAVQLLNNYAKHKEAPRMMMVLDSLGMLSTEKEVKDITEGNDKRDMTRTQLIRGAFRTIRSRLAKTKIPLIVTNHTYQTMDLYSKSVMSGGGGVKYASDNILMLTKAKDEDTKTKDILGAIITCKMDKSRLSKEKTKVKVRLNYKTGLDRYYGLLPLAEKHGILQKSGNQYIINEKKYFGKSIEDDPEKFFIPEIMEKLEKAAAEEFKYGGFGTGDLADEE